MMSLPRSSNSATQDAHVQAQLAAVVVDGLNRARDVAAAGLRYEAAEANKAIEFLSQQMERQEAAFELAKQEIQRVREFVGSPEKILGSASTKHGESAEHLEVRLTNAHDHMAFRAPSATFDGVGRTAAADYLKDGVEVQSKFINGTRNTLDHVLDHLDKYEDFGRNGSFYEVARDHHDVVRQVLEGGPVVSQDGELGARSVRAIQDKIAEIERLTGRSIEDVVRPATSTYAEVQQGVIHKTIDGHEEIIANQHGQRMADLESRRSASETTKSEKEAAAADAERPTLEEAGQAAAIGAAMGAALRLASVVLEKRKQGKTVAEVFRDDWKEIGIEAGKGGKTGAVSGAAIYLLTNSIDMAAPVAGAVVSSTKGLASLMSSLERGDVTDAECAAMAQSICADGAAIALGAALGQALIPLPVAGAFLGSQASRFVMRYVRQHTGPHAAVLLAQLERQLQDELSALDDEQRTLLADIEAKYAGLCALADIAFDVELNTRVRLDASVVLASEMGVSAERILSNIQELDALMLGRPIDFGANGEGVTA